MAAAHHLEIEEDVNLNMDREMKEELEEEEVREGGADKDPFKPRKVHRIVSKWMLPEPVRRTYLERANCLPPPVFIISISIAEVNMRGAVHRREDSWGLQIHWGFRSVSEGRLGHAESLGVQVQHTPNPTSSSSEALPGASCLPRHFQSSVELFFKQLLCPAVTTIAVA